MTRQRLWYLGRWLPTLIICGIIFWLSSLTGVTIDAAGLGEETYHIYGHFILYTLLALTLYLPLKNNLAGFILTIVYGISDELHQVFVPGRAWESKDLVIDALGALVGVGIVLVICKTNIFHIQWKKLKKLPAK